jgi:hypothetical protein
VTAIRVGLIGGGTSPTRTEREGIEVLGMILAAYEGARRGSVAPVIRA